MWMILLLLLMFGEVETGARTGRLTIVVLVAEGKLELLKVSERTGKFYQYQSGVVVAGESRKDNGLASCTCRRTIQVVVIHAVDHLRLSIKPGYEQARRWPRVKTKRQRKWCRDKANHGGLGRRDGAMIGAGQLQR
jgi:hypothetical protein